MRGIVTKENKTFVEFECSKSFLMNVIIKFHDRVVFKLRVQIKEGVELWNYFEK